MLETKLMRPTVLSIQKSTVLGTAFKSHKLSKPTVRRIIIEANHVLMRLMKYYNLLDITPRL